MKIYELHDNRVNEAPVSGIKQGLKKFGAKALAKVGAKDTAMGIAGQVDTGDEANKLRSEFQNYIGQTGQSMKQIDPADLTNWLKSKGYKDNALKMVQSSGIIDKKNLDATLLKVVQASKKIQGAGQQPADAKADPKATQQTTNTDAVDKSTATGSSSVAGANKAPPTQNGSAAGPAGEIPANIQAQLDLLNAADKKRLASMI